MELRLTRSQMIAIGDLAKDLIEPSDNSIENGWKVTVFSAGTADEIVQIDDVERSYQIDLEGTRL